MNVKLVSVTQSKVEGQDLSPEELLTYIARCSNPSNQLNTATSDKLLRFLIKQKHWSPFDMVNLTVEVKTSKAIAIQILRHWSIKPQEFSQRYAEVTEIEPIELRKQGVTNRQSSTDVFDPEIKIDMGNDIVTDIASSAISDFVEYSQNLYKALLNAGVAKECARMVLPMATTTTMYLNASVRSWLFYLSQRLDAHAQLEHQEVAKEIEDIFKQQFPNVHKAFFDNE